MEVLLFAIALLFGLLVALGFGLLLVGLVSALAAVFVAALEAFGVLVLQHVFGLSAEGAREVLTIEGLGTFMARRLRAEIARVLRLAPRDSSPRACACVKPVDGAFVGVLRIFTTQGHYLLRARGGTPVAVARQLSTSLEESKDHFPAAVGTERVDCPECTPQTCPLVRRGLEGPFAAMPA